MSVCCAAGQISDFFLMRYDLIGSCTGVRRYMSNIVVKKSNELIDPQAQMLVGFLKEMGLPSENIIADQEQRRLIGDNLDNLIRNLPAETKKDARYLSKFVIGAGFGLFDYSLNAVWNEVVINLRRKATVYGLDIVTTHPCP
jgi:hypothetical protein